MKLIRSKAQLAEHIQRCHIQDAFSFDVSEIAELFSFHRGEFLIEAGLPGDYLYFLTSGKLQVYTYTISEKTHYQNYYQNIAPILGEVNVLWGNPASSSVQALTNGTCIGISAVRFRDRILDDNCFLRYICQTMAERLQTSGQNTALDPVEVRLAAFILANQEDGLFSFKLSTCANLLDTSYRHLFRVINKLCADQTLEKTDAGYQIIQPNRLKLLSKGKLQFD